MFQGFKFETPKKDDKEEINQENKVSELTFQFSRISANEGSRLESFQAHRSPLASRSRAETQERRRLEALELQKKQRSITVSKARQLALGTAAEEEEEEEEEEEAEEKEEEEHVSKRSRDLDDDMEEVTKIVKTNPRHKKKQHKRKNIHADQIMYAENLESIPDDFVDNWVMMICPKGKRCLVTSGRGETIARSRAGHIIGRFQSMIPNGSRYSI
ncbi:hypothetical protein EDC94DRAFT_516153 [Helicostylum pulchrum]|nr:hypothetical protein EDC94DRAFT_516153 [Helicostylum pulchrum]